MNKSTGHIFYSYIINQYFFQIYCEALKIFQYLEIFITFNSLFIFSNALLLGFCLSTFSSMIGLGFFLLIKLKNTLFYLFNLFRSFFSNLANKKIKTDRWRGAREQRETESVALEIWKRLLNFIIIFSYWKKNKLQLR